MPNVKRLKVERGPVSAGASGGGDPPEDRNNGEERLRGHYTERNKSTTKSKTAMKRRRSARMSTTSRRATTSRMNSISKKRHNDTDDSSDSSDEDDEGDSAYPGFQIGSAYPGFQIMPTLEHDIDYDPPYVNHSNPRREDEDVAMDAALQFEVDRAIYGDNEEERERGREASRDNSYREDEESDYYFELDDVSARIDEAYDNAADCWEFWHIANDNPRDEYANYDIFTAVNNAQAENDTLTAVNDLPADNILNDDTLPIEGWTSGDSDLEVMVEDEVSEQEAEDDEDVEIVVAVDPARHTQIFYETGRWLTYVDSRYPLLTDMLEERRYVQGLRGMFRVPFHVIWQLIAQSGLGQNGWPYSVVHQNTVFRNDGTGPI